MRLLMALIIKKDQHLFYFLNKRIKCASLDKIMPLLTHLGSITFAGIVSILMLLLDWFNIVKDGIYLPFCIVTTQAFILAIKLIVNRPRPTLTLENIHTFDSVLEYYSFPSGHTAAAFAMAISLTIICHIPVITIILLIIATLVGISRIYIGVHYPTDVTIGAILSIIVIVFLQPNISYFYNLL